MKAVITMLLTNCVISGFALIATAASASHGGAEEKKVIPVFSKSSFYRMSPGTLAYVPTATDSEMVRKVVIFRVLGESGAYRIKKKQRYCFVVNHRTWDIAGPTYLGVLIMPYMTIRHADPTSILYAKDWIRPNDPGYRRENGKTKVLHIKANKFFQLHSSTKKLAEFDSKLGVKWHGWVNGTNLGSWDKRYYWDMSTQVQSQNFLQRFSPAVSQATHKRVDALLLSFSPTHSLRPKRPLSFCFSGDNRKAVFIKTFAENSTNFEREYYLTFY